MNAPFTAEQRIEAARKAKRNAEFLLLMLSALLQQLEAGYFPDVPEQMDGTLEMLCDDDLLDVLKTMDAEQWLIMQYGYGDLGVLFAKEVNAQLAVNPDLDAAGISTIAESFGIFS